MSKHTSHPFVQHHLSRGWTEKNGVEKISCSCGHEIDRGENDTQSEWLHKMFEFQKNHTTDTLLLQRSRDERMGMA